MLAGSGTDSPFVPTTPVAGPQLSQMISIAHDDIMLPGGFVEFSSSWPTLLKPPTRVSVKVNDESVPAPPPCALKRIPYWNVPKPSIPTLDGFPLLTSEYVPGRPVTPI